MISYSPTLICINYFNQNKIILFLKKKLSRVYPIKFLAEWRQTLYVVQGIGIYTWSHSNGVTYGIFND
jgi:hypothetical protein